MTKNLLKNIFVPINGAFEKKDILFDEKLLEISGNIQEKDGYITHYCDGLYAMPGYIDSHVHFNTPGFEHHETFEKGTRGAIKGGVTTIIDMPCTSLPPVVSLENLNNKLEAVKGQAYCDFAFHGGIEAGVFNEEKDDIEKILIQLKGAGVRAIKVYTVSGMDTFRELSNNQLYHVFSLAAGLGIPVVVHAEDASMVRERERRMKGSGRIDVASYAYSRSEEAELIAVNTCGLLAKLTGARVHIAHVSCQKSVELVNMWRHQGASISCETCPHYMAFDINSLERMGGILKTAPVVKTEQDAEALWKYFADGDISFITTDHAPCDPEKEKNTGSIWTDYSGIPGVQTVYSYILSEGLLKKKITLSTITESIKKCAELFSLKDKGEIKVGKDADITIWDFKKTHKVAAGEFESVGKYSPFDGWTFSCLLSKVFLRGELTLEDDNILQKKGRFIK